MVEERYSAEVMDRILLGAKLPSGSAYTAVGTYDHGEMWSLVIELSKVLEVPVPELFRFYGEHFSYASRPPIRTASPVQNRRSTCCRDSTTSFTGKCASCIRTLSFRASKWPSEAPSR
jgi:hypothetical protein